MHANRVGLDRDLTSIDRADHVFAQHTEHSCGGFLDIVQERVRLAPRDEPAVGLIVEIGKNFPRYPQSKCLAGAGERAAARRKENERVIHREKRVRHRLRQRGVARRHVVERAMRLQVILSHPERARD